MKLLEKIIKTERKIQSLLAKKDLFAQRRIHVEQTGKIKTTWICHVKYNTNSSRIAKCKKREKKLHERIKREIFFQNDYVLDHLFETDERFREIAEINYRLIENKTIRFVNKKTRYHMLTSHSLGFYGEMNLEGYINCWASKVSLVISGLQRGLYPLAYKGAINPLGQIGLKIKEKGYSIIGGKVPTKFDGEIGSGGLLSVKTTEAYREFGGAQYVSKLIGRISFEKTGEEHEFIQNSLELKSMIKKFRATIIN